MTTHEKTDSGAAVARLGPGGYFGEIAILLDMPRTAYVRAITTVQVLVLSKADFKQVCMSYPDLIERFKMLADQTLQKINQQVKKKKREKTINTLDWNGGH